MHYPSLARVAASIGTGFAALALSAGIAAAQSSQTQPPTPEKTAAGSVASACTVKFAVDSIPASPTPVAVNASVSSAVGDSVEASLPAESSISVVSVSPAASGDANALQLTLNTSAAKAGEWLVAVKGKSGECSGKLKIVGGK